MNGYVTLDTKYSNHWSEELPVSYLKDLPIIAPFWSDFDSTGKNASNHDVSTIWLHEYVKHRGSDADEMTRFVMTLAQKDVEDYGNDLGFDPSHVIVVTWENMKPYPFSKNSKEVRTYMINYTRE